MQFQHDGKTYRISFVREHRDVNVIRKDRKKHSEGRIKTVRSKYPFTTVKVTEMVTGEPGKVAYRATVGCHPKDRYSTHAGALAALRALTDQHRRAKGPESFRVALWQGYNSRLDAPVKAETTVTNPQKLLTAGSGDVIEGEVISSEVVEKKAS